MEPKISFWLEILLMKLSKELRRILLQLHALVAKIVVKATQLHLIERRSRMVA